jgi:dolichol-phosphate mannosyltransferase
METSVKYSVVIPVYNEEEVLDACFRRVKDVMEQTGKEYEIIFVNDGSYDSTLQKLEHLSLLDRHVKWIDFSRNFGHQIAITAGMDAASGEAVIVMDADLQDPPELILEMISKWKEGYDVVYAKRQKRQGETWYKKVTAVLFYRLLQKLTDLEIPLDTGDFRLIDRKVCDVLKTLKEKNRFVRGIVTWVGFRQTAVEYVRDPRYAGETKYPLKKMLKLSIDAITSFSYKPLMIASYVGFAMSSISFLYLLYVLYLRLFGHDTVAGWASTVSIMLFFNGITLMMLGVMGQYIGRIYDESRNRPLYVVRRTMGFGRGQQKFPEDDLVQLSNKGVER